MENKAAELNAGIRSTIEQLANETDAAVSRLLEKISSILGLLLAQPNVDLAPEAECELRSRVQQLAATWTLRSQRGERNCHPRPDVLQGKTAIARGRSGN